MRGNVARALLPALVVLTLVGVVAVAATGSTPTGSGDTRSPIETLLDTIFSLTPLALVVAAAMFVYGLTQREAIARELASGRHRRTGVFGFLAFMLLFTALVSTAMYLKLGDWRPPQREAEQPVFPGTPSPGAPTTGSEAGSSYEPEVAWLPVLAVLALAATAGAAAFLAARRRTAGPTDEDALAEAVVAVLEDTLDDLRAEADSRRAVIAAYARLERVLAAHGLPRRVSETPEEYLARILVDLEVDRRAVRRLTDLFTRAKFSQHEVDLGMKGDAIDALEQVRDELRISPEPVGAGYARPLHPDEASA